jgi:hypothetical protein
MILTQLPINESINVYIIIFIVLKEKRYTKFMIESIFLPSYAWSTKGFMPWGGVYRNNRCNIPHSNETKSIVSDQLNDVTQHERPVLQKDLQGNPPE